MQTTLITVIGIALIVMAIFLVISVLMQSSKNNRGVGSVAGGAETFFGKTKGKTMDALFNKLTTVVTIIFVILVIVLYIIQPDTTEVPELVLPENEVSDVIDDAAQQLMMQLQNRNRHLRIIPLLPNNSPTKKTKDVSFSSLVLFLIFVY